MPYWIGGSYESHEGDWRWTDGTSMKMGTPFCGDGVNDQIQEPDGGLSQNCIWLNNENHFFFFDVTCETSAEAICEQIQ